MTLLDYRSFALSYFLSAIKLLIILRKHNYLNKIMMLLKYSLCVCILVDKTYLKYLDNFKSEFPKQKQGKIGTYISLQFSDAPSMLPQYFIFLSVETLTNPGTLSTK